MKNAPKPPMPTSVMVVGGAGFLGSHTVDRLLSEGIRVSVVDDLSSGSLPNLSEARGNSVQGSLGIDTLDATVGEFTELVRRRSPDVVVLCAAFLGPGDDVRAAGRSYSLVLSVLEACRATRVGKVVVVIPGDLLYGEVPSRELPVKEDRPLRPVGSLGVTATATLELLDLYRRDHGLDFTALAVSTIYGPRQSSTGGIVAEFLTAFRDGVPPVVRGDGRRTLDVLYVADAVDAIFRALTRGGGLLLHVASGEQTGLRSILQTIGIETVVPEKVTGRTVARMALSPARARLHLGWVPWTGLAEGIALTVTAND
ncbi:MAG: NAD-dependent epimerase/dehydratase family protein [Actinobacteria bacterium]|nr:NAD-dependent epimerase/dehydratase family protein [Actinomycetota bacterium]